MENQAGDMEESRPPFEMMPFGAGRDGKFGERRPCRRIGPQKGYRACLGLSNQTGHEL